MPIFISLVFLLALIPAYAAGYPPEYLGLVPAQTILKGEPVEATDPIAASTVLVVRWLKDQPHKAVPCSGTLLAPNLVVTAAHCVHENHYKKGPALPPELFSVYLKNVEGASLDPRFEIKASAVVSQPGFDAHFGAKGARHDIALLRLSADVPAPYAPAKLLPSSEELRERMQVTVAGYGQTQIKGGAGLKLHKYGKYAVRSLQSADRSIILRGHSGQGSYFGDSGGPAFLETGDGPAAWGVFSSFILEWGRAYYTDLRREKDWIEKTAAAMGVDFRFP
jgi:secreted trypsin-like serine protease